MAYSHIPGYTVLRQIGQGAGSVIYKVHDDVSDRLLAVKCVLRKSRAQERFVHQVENEFAVGSSLKHSHLVEICGLQRLKRFLRYRQWNLIMEWVNGESLGDNSSYPLEKLIEFFIQSARTLEYMHARGIIHGDMKPSNILVSAGGGVKIVDLGLAGPVGIPRQRVQGTLDFIAPEQVHKHPLTEQTDIYNLGASFYTIFTGRRLPSPIPDSEGGLGMPIRDRMIPMHKLKGGLPVELSDIVSTCCQWQPKDRLPSMGRLAELLETVLEKLSAEARQPQDERPHSTTDHRDENRDDRCVGP